jgi:hypothetical protein
MNLSRIFLLILLLFNSRYCFAQADTLAATLRALPARYINIVDEKVDRYGRQVSSATEKVLAKLSRWEKKIRSILLKADPESVNRLFGNEQATFSTILQKLKEGKAIAENYMASYDEYRDKLATTLKYLEQKKDELKDGIMKQVGSANTKLAALEKNISNAESVEQFIKQRKKLLLDEALKYVGKSKYLSNIDKESYYYIETLRNYKELFSDKHKLEEAAIKILNKVPGFQRFIQQNSVLASLFRSPYEQADMSSLNGLQTRLNVQAIVQERISSGGPNAQAAFSQNFQQAQAELTRLKDKVIKAGGNNSETAIPNFKPNSQRSKTFLQRLEYGSNFQFVKNNSFMPTTADIGLNVGYKLNDKSIVGIGITYKLGIGSIQHIKLNHQGIGFRSFIDWKLKKQFFVTGGLELNYNSQFKNIPQLKDHDDWQGSGLIGITRKLSFKTKLFKGTKLQLLYDLLYRQHSPVSKPVLLRAEYSFK